MTDKSFLKEYVLEALKANGPSSVTDIAKFIWNHHEAELRKSGETFYTWQYDMRWAGQALQNEGKLLKKGPNGTWKAT
jgi:hypothetical protein